MSGLDGLGWPNPNDEPKPKKTMNSQLEIKLAPTPESDKAKIAFTSLFANDDAYWIPYAIGKKLERERDDIRAQLREEQQLHVQTLNERDEAREHIANLKASLTAAIRSANVCQAAAEKATAGKERLANAIRNAAGVLSCENV